MRAKRFNIDWIYSGSFSEEVTLKDPKDEMETQTERSNIWTPRGKGGVG